MATYIGDFHRYFNGFPGPFSDTIDQTISDDGSDGIFTPGETVTIPGSGTMFTDDIGTFVGYIEIHGTNYPIFSDNNAGGSLADNPLLLVVPPGFDNTILPNDLSGAVAGPMPECFVTGTHIATPTGETKVEDLKIGDQILTAEGKTIAVKWIGIQRAFTAFRPPERLMPVRVSAGALGGGLPKRDLLVTSDHALLVDDLLINAGALVNGSTIDYVPLSEFGEFFEVYHVETENHDLILAEGTPAETFIDYIGRSYFQNYAEYLELYGEERIIVEMDRPRISTNRLVPETVRQRLATADVA